MRLKNIYISNKDEEFLRNNFFNLRFVGLVSIDDIVNDNIEDIYNISEIEEFTTNLIIKHKINEKIKRKKFNSIIITNSIITKEFIISIYELIKENDGVNKFILFDEKQNPNLEQYYELFEEVAFFPSIKKIKINECDIMIK